MTARIACVPSRSFPVAPMAARSDTKKGRPARGGPNSTHVRLGSGLIFGLCVGLGFLKQGFGRGADFGAVGGGTREIFATGLGCCLLG